MLLFAIARSGWVVLVAFWALLGPAAGVALYEPAYVAVGHWVSENNRNKAIALLSLVAGLAGPLFVPATGFLLDRFGWRRTALILGAVFLIAAIGRALCSRSTNRESTATTTSTRSAGHGSSTITD
jgi:MFS family permease